MCAIQDANPRFIYCAVPPKELFATVRVFLPDLLRLVPIYGDLRRFATVFEATLRRQHLSEDMQQYVASLIVHYYEDKIDICLTQQANGNGHTALRIRVALHVPLELALGEGNGI